MCFSTEVSFGASAILLGVGVASTLKIKNPSEIMFASIPVIFAIQQFTEGILWLSFSYPSYASWQQGATNIFLLFAQVLWPTWIPLSLLALEKEPTRKRFLMAFTALGLMVSCFLDYRLIHFGAKAEVIDRHIFYEFDFVYGNTGITGVFYFIASVLPLFVSGVKKMKILGSAAVASLLITQIFYSYFIISVWCFFAAIMSVIVYGIMVEMRKDVLQPGFVPAETT